MEQFKLEPLRDPRVNANQAGFVFVGVMMTAVAAVASITVVLVSPGNALSSVIEICGFSAITATSLMAYMQSRITHDMVNSDLEKWIQAAGQVRYDMGLAQGAHDANERTDMLAELKRTGPNG